MDPSFLNSGDDMMEDFEVWDQYEDEAADNAPASVEDSKSGHVVQYSPPRPVHDTHKETVKSDRGFNHPFAAKRAHREPEKKDSVGTRHPFAARRRETVKSEGSGGEHPFAVGKSKPEAENADGLDALSKVVNALRDQRSRGSSKVAVDNAVNNILRSIHSTLAQDQDGVSVSNEPGSSKEAIPPSASSSKSESTRPHAISGDSDNDFGQRGRGWARGSRSRPWRGWGGDRGGRGDWRGGPSRRGWGRWAYEGPVEPSGVDNAFNRKRGPPFNDRTSSPPPAAKEGRFHDTYYRPDHRQYPGGPDGRFPDPNFRSDFHHHSKPPEERHRPDGFGRWEQTPNNPWIRGPRNLDAGTSASFDRGGQEGCDAVPSKFHNRRAPVSIQEFNALKADYAEQKARIGRLDGDLLNVRKLRTDLTTGIGNCPNEKSKCSAMDIELTRLISDAKRSIVTQDRWLTEFRRIQPDADDKTTTVHVHPDKGNHFCKHCSFTADKLVDFLSHISSKPHLEATKSLEPPGKVEPEPSGTVTEVEAGPMRGSEFLSVVKGFHCSLCKTFHADEESITAHMRGKQHYLEFQNLMASRPLYQAILDMERFVLTEKSRQAKRVDSDRNRMRYLIAHKTGKTLQSEQASGKAKVPRKGKTSDRSRILASDSDSEDGYDSDGPKDSNPKKNISVAEKAETKSDSDYAIVKSNNKEAVPDSKKRKEEDGSEEESEEMKAERKRKEKKRKEKEEAKKEVEDERKREREREERKIEREREEKRKEKEERREKERKEKEREERREKEKNENSEDKKSAEETKNKTTEEMEKKEEKTGGEKKEDKSERIEEEEDKSERIEKKDRIKEEEDKSEKIEKKERTRDKRETEEIGKRMMDVDVNKKEDCVKKDFSDSDGESLANSTSALIELSETSKRTSSDDPKKQKSKSKPFEAPSFEETVAIIRDLSSGSKPKLTVPPTSNRCRPCCVRVTRLNLASRPDLIMQLHHLEKESTVKKRKGKYRVRDLSSTDSDSETVVKKKKEKKVEKAPKKTLASSLSSLSSLSSSDEETPTPKVKKTITKKRPPKEEPKAKKRSTKKEPEAPAKRVRKRKDSLESRSSDVSKDGRKRARPRNEVRIEESSVKIVTAYSMKDSEPSVEMDVFDSDAKIHPDSSVLGKVSQTIDDVLAKRKKDDDVKKLTSSALDRTSRESSDIENLLNDPANADITIADSMDNAEKKGKSTGREIQRTDPSDAPSTSEDIQAHGDMALKESTECQALKIESSEKDSNTSKVEDQKPSRIECVDFLNVESRLSRCRCSKKEDSDSLPSKKEDSDSIPSKKEDSDSLPSKEEGKKNLKPFSGEDKDANPCEVKEVSKSPKSDAKDCKPSESELKDSNLSEIKNEDAAPSNTEAKDSKPSKGKDEDAKSPETDKDSSHFEPLYTEDELTDLTKTGIPSSVEEAFKSTNPIKPVFKDPLAVHPVSKDTAPPTASAMETSDDAPITSREGSGVEFSGLSEDELMETRKAIDSFLLASKSLHSSGEDSSSGSSDDDSSSSDNSD